MCAMPFDNCLNDTDCYACFTNPGIAGCGDNMLYQALGVCVCGSCTASCGLLFGCG
jgi:hypothetical protein